MKIEYKVGDRVKIIKSPLLLKYYIVGANPSGTIAKELTSSMFGDTFFEVKLDKPIAYKFNKKLTESVFLTDDRIVHE